MIVTVFDTESDGFVDEATRLWCIATVNKDSGDSRLFTPEQIQLGLGYLHAADVLVGHNIKGHDLPLMKKLYDWEPLSHQVIVDTVVYSRMLYPKRPPPEGYTGGRPHSIEAWGIRLGVSKPSHEDWTQWSEGMGYRCVEDARINLAVLEELEREAASLPDYYEQLRSDKNPLVGTEGS